MEKRGRDRRGEQKREGGIGREGDRLEGAAERVGW